jgi:hypothetical protein
MHIFAHVWYIKLPMYLLFIWGLYLVVLRGDYPELGAFWAWGGGALKCPLLWIVPRQNHFVLPHINNRYINSYFRFSVSIL